MQVAARECIWNDRAVGTEIVIELTEKTGLFVRFLVNRGIILGFIRSCFIVSRRARLAFSTLLTLTVRAAF